ncbi:hypothetical protein [Methylophilus sp. 13]|uniref:hypothetical protein n=1 Tax=Methylophilus sp. 13 TaxID=2781018 RepID=UPI001E40E337|nr:hypothetical protein [Methylophilus sp. 13]
MGGIKQCRAAWLVTGSCLFSLWWPVSFALASSDSAKVISAMTVTEDKHGSKSTSKPAVIALVNLDEVSPDCQQQVTMARIKTVAYSESGMTPEKIKFDWQGNALDVATNVGENPILTLEEIQAAHQFIRVGKQYLIHFQLCSDGQQRSLINLYATLNPPSRPARKIKS